ncbi:MAG TPA: DM13 domain-containing protein [Candidatus Acidoferrales bacterium]|nr:DM13 domain-containing protein [Candidatus Acidoferrales bacterium]
MSKRNLVIGAGVIVLVIAWYAFRPELLFVDKTVSEGFPGGPAIASIEKQPMVITRGSFKSLAHDTKGTATIYQLADGKRTLRLTEFETSNGPDVRVYLVAAEIENGNDALQQAGFVNLGSMKGNIGDQNYDIPSDVNLAKYKAVSIWCARFGVNFGLAPLSQAMAMAAAK